ncbi:HesB/IscA family protein [Persicitalea jodogahamensis]|uniref:Core domain-containing protein n=1 Tax=Persicitalea jodogahamensis TaxID=402147 RepID=A0A8J3D5B5_9BACT|nr:iron-sulfur cluster biosynthesis family protein [Persicitalea jodogahamensis]GHB76618.1 hypothetical protein GCM10007390_33200 [Persicitalea jodogahamensis]
METKESRNTVSKTPVVNNIVAAPVHISERAQFEIRETFQANKIPDEYGIRVGLRGGACSATFLLGFDVPTPDDQLYEVEGIKVLIDRRHLMYVLGVTVDYEDGTQGAGFTITAESENPTAE